MSVVTVPGFFAERIGQPKKVDPIPGFKMNQPIALGEYTEDVGLEIEVEPGGGRVLPTSGHLERVLAPKSGARWVAKADNSLRNGGLEYVLSKPVFVDELDGMLGGLYDTFASIGAAVNLSNRTSTHVHLNASGLRVNEVTSVILLWSVFENALIEWCGENRKTNHFCLANRDCSSLLDAWEEFLSNGSYPRGEGLKYCALNIKTLWTFGSLEVRCGPAWAEASSPKKWAKFLHALKQYAVERFENPVRMAQVFSEDGASKVFRDVCEKAGHLDFYQEVIDTVGGTNAFDTLGMDSLRRVQKIMYGFPWDDWMELIKKKFVPNPFSPRLFKTPGATGWRAAPRHTLAGAEDAFNRIVAAENLLRPPRDEMTEEELEEMFGEEDDEEMEDEE